MTITAETQNNNGSIAIWWIGESQSASAI
jgi:hypothetical protein